MYVELHAIHIVAVEPGREYKIRRKIVTAMNDLVAIKCNIKCSVLKNSCNYESESDFTACYCIILYYYVKANCDVRVLLFISTNI